MTYSQPLAYTLPTCSHPLTRWGWIDMGQSLRRFGTFEVLVGICRECGPSLVRKVLDPAVMAPAFKAGVVGDGVEDGVQRRGYVSEFAHGPQDTACRMPASTKNRADIFPKGGSHGDSD